MGRQPPAGDVAAAPGRSRAVAGAAQDVGSPRPVSSSNTRQVRRRLVLPGELAHDPLTTERRHRAR